MAIVTRDNESSFTALAPKIGEEWDRVVVFYCDLAGDDEVPPAVSDAGRLVHCSQIENIGDWIDEENSRMGFARPHDPDVLKSFYDRLEYHWSVIPDAANEEPSIVREIEFPPEFYSAGIHLLSHFPTWLNQLHSDSPPARVKITQDGSKVTLSAEAEDGLVSQIEEDLANYRLMIIGETTPAELAPDQPIAVALMEHRLEQAQAELRLTEKLLGMSQQHNRSLEQLIANGLSRNVTVNVTSEASVSAEQTLDLNLKTSELQAALQEVASALPDDDALADKATWAAQELERLGGLSRRAYDDAGVFSTIRELAKDLGDKDSAASRTVRGAKKAGELGADLLKALGQLGVLG